MFAQKDSFRWLHKSFVLRGRRIHIIGAGVAGLAASALLANYGYDVTVIEKNKSSGGRINLWENKGFRFDMGPSWYWMPEIFENFFNKLGSSVEEHYKLHRLDPGYRIFFGENDVVDMPARWEDILSVFESMEQGAATNLKKYMNGAAFKYNTGMNEFVWKPGSSIWEFAQLKVMRSFFNLDMLTSMSGHVRKYFTDPRLIRIMEFPVLFLGAAPWNTPALYSLMNYADLKLGTWYPMGGMHQIARAMETVAREQGVEFLFETEADEIQSANDYVTAIKVKSGECLDTDGIIAAADYHHIDQKLLTIKDRQYSESYWNSRKMAPSSLLYYIGIDTKIDNLLHHNLFFDEDFKQHARTIYSNGEWPRQPLFYACCPSKTDATVAPQGMENLFLLVPLAPGLKDSQAEREKLFVYMVDKLKKYTGMDIRDHLIVKRSFAMDDFTTTYNSFKGNAYGLANTLRQTAILKPSMHHKKLKNLLFAGQMTVPGPGLPPSIISGQLAAKELQRKFEIKNLTTV